MLTRAYMYPMGECRELVRIILSKGLGCMAVVVVVVVVAVVVVAVAVVVVKMSALGSP